MKILFVEQLGKNNWEYIYSAAKYLAENNDVTCYMSDTTPKSNKNYNFKIEYGFNKAYEGNFINKAVNYLKALKKLKKYIKTGKFDVVHFEWFSLPWIEWIYIKSLKRYAKIVITVNDVIPFEQRPLEMKCLEWIYRSADAILVHTNETLKLFNKTYRTNNYKSVITAAFRDKNDYKKVDKNEARKTLGIPLNKDVVLYFGTVRHSKGLDVLIKAFPEALKINPNLFLLGAGAFHAVDEKLYKSLVTENITNESGKLDFKHIPDGMLPLYFSAADILIVPYREIYQSGIAQFGLIYDMPIIGSDIPRLGEMVRKGVNGETFKNEDFKDLAKVMGELSQNKDKLKKYSQSSHDISVTEYSVEERARRTLEAYKVVVGGKTV